MDTSNPSRLSARRRLAAAVILMLLLPGCGSRQAGSAYQTEYFDSAILSSPDRPRTELCSQDATASNGTWYGYCYPVDEWYYIQVVMEFPATDTAAHCNYGVDRIVSVWAIPTGAMDDGQVSLSDYLLGAPAGVGVRDLNIPFGGATLAAARVMDQSPDYERIQVGVFLIDVWGNYYPGAVEAQLASWLINKNLLTLMVGGTNSSAEVNYGALPLTLNCETQMRLAPGVEIIGWLDGRSGAVAAQPPTEPPPSPIPPTATETPGSAVLSGVVYPYATDCTDGVCPSCGQVDVYAVDAVTGAYYYTFVDGLPCRYSIEVPAPGTYTVAALRRENQFCGTYLTQAELDRKAYGYCRICEPGQVNVMPGDTVSDLHIPLYMGPEEWPRGVPCAFIPVETPPQLVTVTAANPYCGPYDLHIGERIVTIPAGLDYRIVASFQIAPGTYKAYYCYAGTTACFEPQTYVWESDTQITLPPNAPDCPQTDGTVFVLWADRVDGCTVTVNGYTVPDNAQGPWTWDWGDGSTNTGWFPQTHTFPGPGDYTVSVQTYIEQTVGDRIVIHVGACR